VFKFPPKTFIYWAVGVLLVVVLAGLIPALQTPVVDLARQPFSGITFVRREISGIFFYHRNMGLVDQLHKEVQWCKMKLNEATEASRENTRITNLLALKQKSALRFVAVRVIGRAPDSWSSSLIIDKGAQQSIKNNFVVINYEGLIGRVLKANVSTSKILLMNDPAFSVSALVQRSRQEGLVSGALGGLLLMKYLPLEADIVPGDMVISSGLTEIFPKGLVIGKVVEVNQEFGGLSKYALIKPAVNLSSIEEALIIIP
jgi:rod shape-determining protein MreC